MVAQTHQEDAWDPFLRLGHAWCSASRDKARDKALFQWLVPSPLEAFQLASHPFDRDVKLSSISFGTLVQLGVFVQHKLFSSSIIDDHRDYWINATFQYDQRVLHVDLHLNHREACAGLIAEYRFIVPYLNITKVHFENRILSEFNAGFAIRVSFRDDNLDKLSFSLNLHSSRHAILNAVVARFLHDGLQVGTREFNFLAPSTSQLRDHGRELLKPTYVVTAIAPDSTTRQSAKVSPLSTCKKKPVSFSALAHCHGALDTMLTYIRWDSEQNLKGSRADELKQCGNRKYKEKAYQEAFVYYTNAIVDMRYSHILYSNRALSALQLQKFKEVELDARCAVILQPNFGKGYFEMAQVYASTKQNSPAEKVLDDYIERCNLMSLEFSREIQDLLNKLREVASGEKTKNGKADTKDNQPASGKPKAKPAVPDLVSDSDSEEATPPPKQSKPPTNQKKRTPFDTDKEMKDILKKSCEDLVGGLYQVALQGFKKVLSQKLGHAWCSASRDKARKKALFQWLVPSPLEAFQLASHPFDRDVKLSSISFGTLVQLGVFVQHKLFSSSIIDDHRDYWINATFHHDQRVLHVDLHLNHREACAGLIAEYRFIVSYLNITKVMINDRNRHVEIYLHLKTPAMVMGEVIMENPSRPGSAAAATPLRWERHLAIGYDCIGDTVRMASLCGGLFLKLVLTDHSLARRVIGRLSQRCTQGTLFCYAPVRTYCPDVVVGRWTVEVLARCEEMERTLPFPCAYAFKAALHITFDVLDQMALMSRTTFEKLMRDIKKRSKEEPLVVERALSHIVSSIDAGNVVMFGPAFYVACSLFKDEKPPQLARSTCLVRSVFVTPGRLIFRPPQVHFENRILSEFNAEFAIRVSFRDDNLDKLSFSLNLHSSRDAILNAVVARFLHDGLQVGTREFKFLAPSFSQLRDHGRELLKPTYVVTAVAPDSTTRQSVKVSPLSTCKKKPVSFSGTIGAKLSVEFDAYKNSKLAFPIGVTATASGNIIVADTSQDRVMVFDPNGRGLHKATFWHAAFSRGGASGSGAMVSMEIEIDISNRTTNTMAVLTQQLVGASTK